MSAASVYDEELRLTINVVDIVHCVINNNQHLRGDRWNGATPGKVGNLYFFGRPCLGYLNLGGNLVPFGTFPLTGFWPLGNFTLLGNMNQRGNLYPLGSFLPFGSLKDG